MATVGFIISVVLICLIFAAAVLIIIKMRREGKKKNENEASDANHVCGTSDVHDNPVANKEKQGKTEQTDKNA